MTYSLNTAVKAFIEQEKLPDDYAFTVDQWFIPLAEALLQKLSISTGTMVVGISGCQGSGKSTLAALLVVLLREMMGVRAINLSIDDFYLRHAERQVLSKSIHPLLATRGVPGSHDVGLAINTIEALKGENEVAIPRFNKAIDDRVPKVNWPLVHGPVDLIILEGWCLNIEAQALESLSIPVNTLEKEEDKDAQWRTYVNEQLQQEYPHLYNLVDYLIMLKAPSFEKVFEWRQNQEDKLSQETQGSENLVMNKEELKRFIQHYERLTRHGLNTLPEQADVVFELSSEQKIVGRS